jgi:protein-disulfide isomerase
MRIVALLGVAMVAFGGGFFAGRMSSPLAQAKVNAARETAVQNVAAADAELPKRQRVGVAGTPKGPLDAPITIVEFADYQCPFCNRARPVVDELLAAYPGKIRFYVRHNPLPFHPNAPLAAEAALAAEGQGKFWEMNDKLAGNFFNLTREDLEKYAQELGLDLAKFKQALDTGVYRVRVDQDRDVAGKIGANGTPTFFVNGRMLVGAQPAEAFKEIIEEELVSAQKLVAKGTRPEKVYEALLAEAQGGDVKRR